MSKRKKTDYPGIYYREANRLGGKGTERVYYIVFKKEGKTIEEKAGRQYADCMTAAKANRIRSERIEGKRLSRKKIRQKQEAKKATHDSRWIISRLWDSYKEGKESKTNLRIDDYRFQKYLHPVFGNKEPREIAPFDIDRLRITLTKTKSPQTVRHVLALLRRIVNYGVKKQLCENLSSPIEMPKVNNIKTEDLKPEQLRKLLETIEAEPNIQASNMMKMALFTGMRKGEMFRLKWDDVDFERGFIHIREPKGGLDQKIPLNDAARELLDNHLKTDSPYVFPGRGGKQRTDIKKPLNRIKKAADLPKDFRPLHGLRHVYASMLASSGQVDMYTLQKLLTHKSPQMTQRYAHLRDEALKKAADLAGVLISQAINRNQEKKIINLDKAAK